MPGVGAAGGCAPAAGAFHKSAFTRIRSFREIHNQHRRVVGETLDGIQVHRPRAVTKNVLLVHGLDRGCPVVA